MSGFIGYTGARPCRPILLDALARLEGRGYDSAGLALQVGERIDRVRTVGPLAGLRVAVAVPIARATGVLTDADAHTGIGHLRWATHGDVTEANAHPHADTTERVHIALSGVVANHAELRARLMAEGATFCSQTDAEVVAHLIAHRDRGDLLQAVHASLADLEGHFAFVAISADQPGLLVGTCRQEPLVVGGGPGDQFLATSAAALEGWTGRVQALDDDDVVALLPDRGELLDGRGRVRRRVAVAPLPQQTPSPRVVLGPALPAAEISDQPHALVRTLLSHLGEESPLPADLLCRVEHVRIVGCGSAFHTGLVGRHVIEEWAGLPAHSEIASEARYRPRMAGRADGELFIGILQLGQSADTLAAMRAAREDGATVVAICDAPSASAARDADVVLTAAAGEYGPITVTNPFFCQLAMIGALALRLAEARGVPEHVLDKLERRLRDWPDLIEQTLQTSMEPVRALAGPLAGAERVLFVGRGAGLPLALEGGLRLREAMGTAAEACAGGEAARASVAPGTTVVAVATGILPKLLGDLAELKLRGARVIVIASERDTEVLEHADEVLWLPTADRVSAAVAAAIPLQLLAHSMVANGGEQSGSTRGAAA